MHAPNPNPRRGGGVVAAVLHDLLRTHRYDSYADVAADLKARCAALRIAYDAAVITEAISQVEESRSRPAVALAVAAMTRELPPAPVIIDRAAAVEIIRDRLRLKLR